MSHRSLPKRQARRHRVTALTYPVCSNHHRNGRVPPDQLTASAGPSATIDLPEVILDAARAEEPGVDENRPIKVAIIGGGCAAIATAFELTRPEHRGKYDVTIYQLGWRLGGKGASGRGPNGRIEEHGFHVWMGCYENAFRLMRECYAELKRDPHTCRIADWRDGFFPAPFLTVAAPRQDGSYSTLVSYFPAADGLPGDPIISNDPFSVSSYLAHTANALRTMLLTVETKLARADRRGIAE